MKNIKIFFILSILLSIITVKLHSFDTLKDILAHANSIPEYPQIDNQDYLKPDFASFYKKSVQSPANRFIIKAFNFLKIKKEFWSPKKFASLLKKVADKQEKDWNTGDYIIKNTPQTKTKFVIWGDLQGAFHSFARDLKKLQEENYLTDDLKIVQPDCFFVFDGNVLGRSAYIMETLTIILSLMEKNPKQIIYIKGEQELNDNWKNFGLEQELQYKAKYFSNKTIPLEDSLNKFLNTLPLALYIKLPSNKTQKFIRISYFDRNFIKLNEFTFADFLQKSSGNIDILNLNDKKTSDQQISLEAIIEGKDRSLQYQKTDGLQLLLPDKGATAWSILSCPTLSSQKLYNFSNDAFVILSVDPTEKLNLITLYKQNADEPKGFATKTYNIISEEVIKEEAAKVTEKVLAKEGKIVIGSSLDLFGVSYVSTKQIYQGLNLFFKKLNSLGGIKGKEINYIVLNDQYDPTIVNKNIDTFLNVYKTNIILVIGGTPTTKAALPRVAAKEILVAFPYTGASIFRKPELKYFIHLKTSYEKESFALAEYAIKQMNLTKFAMLYQDDDFGKECIKGTIEALEKNGIKNWVQAPYKNEKVDIDEAAKKIINFNPQAIMLFSREKPALSLIGKLGSSISTNKIFFAGSYMSDEFREQLKQKEAKIVLLSTVPNPQSTDLEILRDYQKDMQTTTNGKEISYNTASLTGYIYAAVFSELLKRIDGEITKEKIIEQAEKIKNENFKGLTLNFDPQTRELFNQIWISTLDNKWIKPGEKEVLKAVKEESAKPAAPEEKREIQVGLNADLTGALAAETKPNIDGISDYIREENKKSKNNNIKLTILDNKLDPALMESNTEKLLGSGIKIFLQPMGSFILEKMLPTIKDKSIFLLNGTQSPMFRKPELKNIINYFPSSFQSASVLTQYLIEKAKDKKIAIIYQMETYGQGAYQGCVEAFKNNNLQEDIAWKAFGHAVEKADDPKIIDAVRKFNPEIIFIISYDTGIKTIIKNLGADFLINKTIATTDISDEIKDFFRKQNLNYISTQIIPDLNASDFELVKEYRKTIGNKAPAERYFEGYLSAAILVALINKNTGEITPQKLLETAENIKNQDLGGFALNFDPKSRSILNNVWIEHGGKIFLYQEKSQEKAPTEKPISGKRNITIGSNLDLTTVMSEDSKPTIEGILLALQEENKTSQINNLKFTYYDNKFKIDLIKNYTQKMLDDKINIFMQPTGSFIFEKMLPLIKDKPVCMLCGATSPIFRKPELKNLINYFPSSFQSAKALAECLIGKMNRKRIAVIYQLEPYGQGAFEGCEFVFKKYNLKKDVDWIPLGHQAEEISNPKVIDAIKKFSPDALVFATYDAALRDLTNNLGAEFLFNRTVGAIEISGEVKDFLFKKNIKFVSTQLVPDTKTSNLEIAKECVKKLGQETVSPRTLEGYIGTNILIYLINKIEGEVTPQKLLQAAEGVKNENLKGLVLNFDPTTRSILSDVWLDTGDGKPFIYKETEEEKKEAKKAVEEKAPTPAPTTQPTVEKKPEKTAPSEIKVGCTLDQNGKSAEYVKSFAIGLKTKISKINSSGGIKNKTINLIIRDDEFIPGKASENIEKFLSEDKTDIMLSSFGSFTFTGILPFIKDQKIAMFFPEATSPDYQNKEYKNLVTCFGSSYQESKILFEYIINKLKLKKIAIFYEEEPFSQGAFNGAKEVLEKNNLKENVDWKVFAREMQTKSSEASTQEIVDSLKSFDPEGIALLSLQSTTQALILEIPRDYLESKKCFGISTMSKIKKMLEDRGLKFISTQLVPDPINSTIELVKEYRKDMSERGIPLDTYSLEGYFAASLFAELVAKVEGDITKEKLIEQAEKTKNYDFKGLTLNFDPETRNIFGCVFLDTKEGEPILYKPEIAKPQEVIPEKAAPSKEVKKTEEEKSIKVESKADAASTGKEDFIVGNSMDLSKGGEHWGKADLRGIRLSINKTNREGGINGRKMKLVNYDDKNDPNLALENVQNLINKNIDFIIHPFGGTSIQKYLSLIKENKIAVIFSASTDTALYNPEPQYLTNFFLSSKDTAKTITEYAIKELSLKKFAVFYEMDSYSQTALNGAIEIFKKFNLQEGKDWISEGHQPDTTDILPSANKIKEFVPQGILLFAVYQAHTSLVDSLGAAFLNDKVLLPLESDGEIVEALKKRNLRLATTQTLPDIDSDIEIAKQFKEELKKQEDDKSSKLLDTAFSAFVATELFFDIVKNLQKPITKENVIQSIEKVKDRDFRGIKMDFNPQTRAILKNCYIYTTEGKVIPYSLS
jgi:ABC-type branched-subunit amino acid transport system substrate-binding protein